MRKIFLLTSFVLIGSSLISCDDDEKSTNITQIDGEIAEFVDMGLSVKWASWNVGASSIQEVGNHYAWAESDRKTNFEWGTYKYSNGSASTMTKYCLNGMYGKIDSLSTIQAKSEDDTKVELGDDVAKIEWGDNWRMPTAEEWKELLDNTKAKFYEDTVIVTQGNSLHISGYLLRSKVNNNYIILPASGYCENNSLIGEGMYGNYWSSSLYDKANNEAVSLYFGSSYINIGHNSRFRGQSIRPVYCGK
ncbi:MAG: hypothetical protein J6Y72_07145 [Bacteroidales bacterium]|nr:hypothetical protein [Bacteroidales bacterium]